MDQDKPFVPKPSSRCIHNYIHGAGCVRCKRKGFIKWKELTTPANKAKTAAARAARKKKTMIRRGKAIPLQLQFRHHIGGIAYGPGSVIVKPDIADMLREQEQRHLQNEQNLHGSQAGVVIVGASGAQVRRVAPEAFDFELGRMMGV